MGYGDCPTECPLTLNCANAPDKQHWCAPLQDGFRRIGGDEYSFHDFVWFYRAIITVFVQTTGDGKDTRDPHHNAIDQENFCQVACHVTTGGLHTMPLALREAGCTLDTAAWVISFFATIFLNLSP